jgi:hypothetical protein
MEDIMVNRVNVMNGRSEVETSRRERRGEAASIRLRKQAASKQSELYELSCREDEERLQSVGFGTRPQ